MTHKDLDFQGPQQLVSPSAIEKVHRAWHKSIAHQVNTDSDASAAQMIEEVSRRIMQYL